jgi:uncharacterized protein (TIGR02271 family)
MTMRKLTAAFDSQADAQRAQDRLLELGVPREHINILDQSSGERTAGEPRGMWASFKEIFMPDEDRVVFEESVRRGSNVLIAMVDDDRVDQAIATLENCGAIDLEQQQQQWRAAGWQDQPAGQAGTTQGGATQGGATEEAIPIVQEQLRVGKREVNRGGVRVRSYIVEEPVHEEVRLREERVDIERRPVNEPTTPVAAGSPEDLLKERTVELTETAEEPVVAKEAVVTEELRVRKRADERVEQVDDTVRHTEVEVDDTRQADQSPSGSDETRQADRRRSKPAPAPSPNEAPRH